MKQQKNENEKNGREKIFQKQSTRLDATLTPDPNIWFKECRVWWFIQQIMVNIW